MEIATFSELGCNITVHYEGVLIFFHASSSRDKLDDTGRATLPTADELREKSVILRPACPQGGKRGRRQQELSYLFQGVRTMYGMKVDGDN